MVSSPTLYALRFGLGFRPGISEPQTVSDMLAQLQIASQQPSPTPLGGRTARLAFLDSMDQELQASKSLKGVDKGGFRRFYNREFRNVWIDDVHAKITHAVVTPYGFYERLVNFWASHFAVNSTRKTVLRGMVGDFEGSAIRPYVGGYFSDMLWHVETHAAMIIYLDQHLSIGPGSAFGQDKKKGLNENLAREILELHTLGVNGGYTQNDVRQFAELMTGMGVKRRSGEFRYHARRAEPGQETILGRTYGGRKESLDHVQAAMDDLARHPATAAFVSWKLARHFVADAPPRSLVDRMAQAFIASGGYLPKVYEVMLSAPESAATFGQKVRQPLDFIIAGLRAVNAHPKSISAKDDIGKAGKSMGMDSMGSMASMMDTGTKRGANALTFYALSRMNQPQWQPPGPDGWPVESGHWMTPQGLSERIRWSKMVGRKYDVEDPRALLERSLRDAVTPDTLRWVSAAATKAEGITLALSSPEFNRR